jgi:peroxiredoxin
MKAMRHVALVVGLLATAGIAYGAFSGFAVREKMPSVGYTLLDGTKTTTDSLRGRVVLVNFWATSCTTCMHEMPQIVATQNLYKTRGYETLGVAMSYDPPAYVINYAETRKLPFAVAIDNTGAIADSFKDVRLTPTSVLIDKHGNVVKRYVGEPDFVALHRLIEKLLAEA